MIDGLETLYKRIADSIYEAVAEDWTIAKMEAVFFTDAIDYSGEYTRIDGVQRGFATLPDGERAFRELRKRFSEAGHQLWGRACLELHSDGKFNMTWGYQDCDDDGYAKFDEDAESRKSEERHKRLSS